MEKYYISSNKYSLRERMTKRGKVYDVVFRVFTVADGERQKRLGGYTTKALAKQAYLDFITEHCELVKNNPLKKKDVKKEVPTVGELYTLYISSLKNQNKDSCIVDKIMVYDNHLKGTFADVRISDLTKEYLYQWQDDIWSMKNPKTKEHYSYNYLSKIRTNLNSFLSWCESRYNYPNELKKVKKPKRRTPKTEMAIWDRNEFDRFISVVDNEEFRAIFIMLFFTGRRKGEVLALHKSDIKKDEIVFSKTYTRKTLDGSNYKITTTKNEKIGKTPISKPLRDLIDNYTFKTPFAFGGEHPIHESTIGHAFERYIEKSGVKKIRLHDLRHSFASMLIHLGCPLTVVADLLGDTLQMVTKTYAHMYDSDKQKYISKL